MTVSEKVQIIETASAEQTFAWAEQFALDLAVPEVIALVGELGAGKTVIAKGIGRGLGVREQVISPTFNYILEYQGRVPMFHADLYRIEKPETFRAMGLEEYFDRKGVFVIEWAERARELLPKDTIWIELTTGKTSGERQLRISRGLP